MGTTVKKRRVITLEVKKQIIDSSAGKSSSQLSHQFDMPKSTIKTILSDKDAILSAIEEGSEAKWARMKTAKHSDLEEAVLRWVKTLRSQNVPITGALLVEKAKELAQELSKPLRKVLKSKPKPLTKENAKIEAKAEELEGGPSLSCMNCLRNSTTSWPMNV